MLNFTYIPNQNNVGQDFIRLFAEDQDGSKSPLMTILIDVYEECTRTECLCKYHALNSLQSLVIPSICS